MKSQHKNREVKGYSIKNGNITWTMQENGAWLKSNDRACGARGSSRELAMAVRPGSTRQLLQEVKQEMKQRMETSLKNNATMMFALTKKVS
ncbi:MAG: hypothetical protein IKN64_02900 [Desulfovibrio sp.]|nr:hypothetical protein [Desulfovibrio sp.]